jgi:hypothetical protein
VSRLALGPASAGKALFFVARRLLVELTVQQWRVHKFGGSSVADAACMERVATILEADPNPRLGVVLRKVP